MGRRGHDDDTRETACRMREAGATTRQIAEELGLSAGTLQNWFKAAGLTRARHVVVTPSVTSRRQAGRSTHVLGGVQHAGLPAELLGALRGAPAQPQPEPELDERVRQLVGAGELLQAAATLDDADAGSWAKFGAMIAPDFLRAWQCGRLLYYLACGVHRGVALARVGISPGDYEEWLAHAANRKEPWRTLVAVCASAQASACARMQHEINSKRPGWQAVAWSLERISPEIYARHPSEDETLQEGAFADVGDDNLKRVALAYIAEDNSRAAVEAECVDIDELLERHQ